MLAAERRVDSYPDGPNSDEHHHERVTSPSHHPSPYSVGPAESAGKSPHTVREGPGLFDISAWPPWKPREISGMPLRTRPMKEMVQRPLMGRVAHAGGLLDKLRHLMRLGNKGSVGALDRFGRRVHPIGHESLRFRSYPVVLLRNEVPRWNRFPAGSSGLFLQRGTCYWTLGDSHHIRHISGCVCAESLVKLVSLDVQLWPAGGTRRVIIGKIGCTHYHWRRKRLLRGNALAHVQADGGQEDQSSYLLSPAAA